MTHDSTNQHLSLEPDYDGFDPLEDFDDDETEGRADEFVATVSAAEDALARENADADADATPSGASVACERPAEERIDDLLKAMAPRRTVLLGILAACAQPQPASAVKAQVDELQANNFSVYSAANLCSLLEKAGALERVTADGDPADDAEIEPETVVVDGIEYLAQGTIYPDIIESGTKPVKAVKSHHNVGGLPEDLKFELVEPLKMLFKDEVRACGAALGLPDSMVYRQPFPGPGLGVRCLGAITRDRLEAVRESDAILREEFAKNGLEGKVWQYFTVIPDLKSVGVREGRRADEWCAIIRAVNTVDAMTATVENVPFDLLQHITARITAEVKGVNRVLFDLTPKPTGTIEWE